MKVISLKKKIYNSISYVVAHSPLKFYCSIRYFYIDAEKIIGEGGGEFTPPDFTSSRILRVFLACHKTLKSADETNVCRQIPNSKTSRRTLLLPIICREKETFTGNFPFDFHFSTFFKKIISRRNGNLVENASCFRPMTQHFLS